MGRFREAADAGRASLRLAEDSGARPQLAWALANLAEQGVFEFDPAATDYAARAIAVGTQLGDDAVVVRARGFAALGHVLRTDTGWDELEGAWHDLMAADTRGENAGILGGFLCVVAALHYDLDRADRYISDFVAYCRDRDMYTFEAVGSAAAALVGLHRGQWAHARACAEDVLTRAGLPAIHRHFVRLTLAVIHARRGEQPVALLDENTANSEFDDLRFFSVWAVRAEAAWLAGDDDTARREAQGALATIGADGDPWVIWQLHRWVQLAGGTPALVAIDDPATPFQLEISGRWREAADAWMWRGCPYEAAIAQLGGDIEAVESAVVMFRRLGARAAARRAQQRVAALRGRIPNTRRADTLSDPDGLTRRERQVLELLADGRSDAQIAAALHISPKTAGCHVSSILNKLGVDNRIQAAAHALQQRSVSTA